MIDLGIGTSKDESTPPASGSDTPLSSSSDIPAPSGDVKTMIITAPNGEVETVEDTPDSRKLAKEKGFIIKENEPLVPQETDEGYDSEYNTGKDRSITAGTIRRLKRGNTIPMSQKERLEARRIQNEFRKKQKQLLDNKKRNESLGLPEITPLTSE